MKITIESTGEMVLEQGALMRVFKGHTPSGVPVTALVGGVGVDAGHDASELERDLIERRAPDHESAARVALDTLSRVSTALALCDGLVPELSDPFHCAVRQIRAALTGEPLAPPSPFASEPPLPRELITKIVDDDRARDGAFTVQAMRGAQTGWHARHAYPDSIAHIGRLRAPVDEPARSAWLVGYRLAAGLDDEAETPPAPEASNGAPEPMREAAAELRARGLDLDAMNRGRVARGMPALDAVVALMMLDTAVNAELAGPAELAGAGDEAPDLCIVCARPCADRICLSCERTGGNDEIDAEGVCRVCGCTDWDCSQCIAKTGEPCSWVELDLCSACAGGAGGDR